MTNQTEYLPIGSVVILNGGETPVMIVGRVLLLGKKQILWDYQAVVYPTGLEETLVYFNQGDVQEILHRGFEDATEEKAQVELNDWIQNNADQYTRGQTE